ncbi:Protein of unknown function [Thermobacillus xylanilyticus]|uniref:Uncharacterized protein n=1 Tax=Thermobacillus xylanilyticus TaxID=76633 RepID=A0ABM8V4X6_THEXY|nr:Protein of unknown function [Thermobacillus xylanilyticus]
MCVHRLTATVFRNPVLIASMGKGDWIFLFFTKTKLIEYKVYATPHTG